MFIVTYFFGENPLLPHRLPFPISSEESFICPDSTCHSLWWASCGPPCRVDPPSRGNPNLYSWLLYRLSYVPFQLFGYVRLLSDYISLTNRLPEIGTSQYFSKPTNFSIITLVKCDQHLLSSFKYMSIWDHHSTVSVSSQDRLSPVNTYYHGYNNTLQQPPTVHCDIIRPATLVRFQPQLHLHAKHVIIFMQHSTRNTTPTLT